MSIGINETNAADISRTHHSAYLTTGLIEKLIVVQLVIFPAFMEPGVSLSWPQEPVTGPYPELDESSPHPHTALRYI
jgi:hypothetical protein